MRLTTLLCTALALTAVLASSADAQPRGRTPARRRAQPAAETVEGGGPAPTIEELPVIVGRLRSANADEVREAITLLTIINDRAAIQPLSELLRSGQSDVITDAALEALQRLAMPEGLAVL